MKEKILGIFVCMLMIGSIFGAMNIAKSGPSDNTGWTVIERGANFVRRQNIDNPDIFSWESAPQWVYNGTAWVPYIFDETDDYYQIQSGLIGTRIYKDGYAEFWNPDMTEIRLYEERWTLEYYDDEKDQWKVCDVYSPTFIVDSDATTVNITASFITDYPNSGERAFDVKYIFREGRPLKHEITFTSHSTEECFFRVKQKWGGIVSDKVKHSKGTDAITSPTIVNSSWFKFLKADGSLSVYENQWEMYYGYNKTTHRCYVLENHNLKPVEIDVHAQGLKADFVFGNWILSQNENLTIDPDTATLDDPTEDGYVSDDYGYFTKVTDEDITFGGNNGINYRGYVEWDISSLAGATLTANPLFRYEGVENAAEDDDEEIKPLTEAHPSILGSQMDLLYLCEYIASGTAYVDPFDLVVDIEQEEDLGASAKSDLQNAMDISQSWFAIGFVSIEGEESEYLSIVAAEKYDPEPIPLPTLYVEYTPAVPPDTSVDTISPYNQTSSPLTITASGSSDLDNVTLWYRYSADNSSWGEENWWNLSWPKRTPVYLNVSTGETKENHTALLNVTYDADINYNFSDLRFIRYADNTTLLDYWIENKSDGNWCKVWVEFRDNITSMNQTLAWMYYGNSGASSLSNGFDTFLFFDGFSGGSLNSSRWPTQSGSITVSNGEVHLDFPGTSYAYAQSNSQNYIGVLEFRSKYTYDSNIARFGSFIKTHYGGTYLDRGIHIWDSGAYILNANDPGVYHKYKIVKTSTNALWYFDDNYEFTRSKSGNISTLTLGNSGEAYRTGDVWFDYIFTRKYASSETTYSIGSEQDSGSWTEWDDNSNPDTSSPWSWDFDFPNGTGYYEFYSIGKKSGFDDETPPDSSDTQCRYVYEIVMNYNFSFSEPEITELTINGTVFHRVDMNGLPINGEIGIPLLPVKPLNILLPQAYVLDSITVTWENNISLGEEFNVELGMEPVIPGQNYTSNESINFDPTIPYPVELFLNVGTYDFRGYNILTFILYPIHYIGETGELYYYDEMNVTVKTINTGEVSPLFRGLQEDEMMIEADEDILDIHNMTLTYANFSENISCCGIANPSESYDYVIITNNDLKNAQGEYTFQTLRDFKNNRGTLTKIVTVEDIYTNYDGDDELEKIRNFIKDAYWWWQIKYVLLGGDNDVIPARRFVSSHTIPEHKPIPSDIYYACLNGNFNFDGDEYYGEIGDLNDYRAEVYIGRACVNTDEEVSIFVNKTITYTTTEDEYLEEVTMVGEFLAPSKTVEIAGHNITFPDLYGGDYMDQLIGVSCATGYRTDGIPSDTYTIDKLYDRDWPGFDPDNSSETGWPKSEIIDRINNNVHIISHLGHGNNFLCMKLDEPVIMRGSEILGECHDIMDNLTNDKPFFLYSQACLSGAFDNKTVRTSWHPPSEEPEFDVPYDCIAEYLTVKTNHGAFAVIANTRYGLCVQSPSGIQPWGPSQHFNRQFWDAIFGESQHCHRLRELGPANQDSKEDNIFRIIKPLTYPSNLWCYYEITLFGDPQIAIKDPEDFEPEWIIPDDHNDIEDAWHNEPLSYDKDTTTKAGCTITEFGWTWTDFIELTLSEPIDCNKIRFYAWYNLFHCKYIDVDIYYDGGWHGIKQGSFSNWDWEEVAFSQQNVSKARVRFYVKRWFLSPVVADLHEFQFHKL